MPQIPVTNDIPRSTFNEALREDAIQEVLKEQAIKGIKLNPYEFIRRVSEKFIENQVDNFPMLCDITRFQNKLKQQELSATGRKGRYTDSIGWSEHFEFKHEFEIPQELHLFMVNLVYKNFWATDNTRVWRPFMLKVLKGDRHTDMQTLMWVKGIYGANNQKSRITTS